MFNTAIRKSDSLHFALLVWHGICRVHCNVYKQNYSIISKNKFNNPDL